MEMRGLEVRRANALDVHCEFFAIGVESHKVSTAIATQAEGHPARLGRGSQLHGGEKAQVPLRD